MVLSSITIPDGVKNINGYAFYGCQNLSSINIPDGVTTIGEYAFYNCTKLSSIIIPVNVTSIGEYAFYECSSLPVINYRGTKQQWDAISKASTSIQLSTFIQLNYTGN